MDLKKLKEEIKQELKQEMYKTILGIGLPAALLVSATVLFNAMSMELGESSVPSFIVGAGVGALSMAWARRAPAHVSTNLENVATERQNIQEQAIIINDASHVSTNLKNVATEQQNIPGLNTIFAA